jgi:predicted DNA-binding antitoxin AbrB/MazE fold protein
MSTPSFQAVYENGVLRPLAPLELAEHAVVSLAIMPVAAPPVPRDEASNALEAWLEEASRLPSEGPDDGLSNRDHDRILYGKPT